MIYILIVISIFVFDQISKNYFSENYKIAEYKPIYKDKIYFTNEKNKGAFYGLLENNRLILMILSFFSLIIILIAFTKSITNKFSFIMKIGFTFILGGALGNLYDRIFKKEVTDFIYIKADKFKFMPIFNIADIFIFLGSIINVIMAFKNG